MSIIERGGLPVEVGGQPTENPECCCGGTGSGDPCDEKTCCEVQPWRLVTLAGITTCSCVPASLSPAANAALGFTCQSIEVISDPNGEYLYPCDFESSTAFIYSVPFTIKLWSNNDCTGSSVTLNTCTMEIHNVENNVCFINLQFEYLGTPIVGLSIFRNDLNQPVYTGCNCCRSWTFNGGGNSCAGLGANVAAYGGTLTDSPADPDLFTATCECPDVETVEIYNLDALAECLEATTGLTGVSFDDIFTFGKVVLTRSGSGCYGCFFEVTTGWTANEDSGFVYITIELIHGVRMDGTADFGYPVIRFNKLGEFFGAYTICNCGDLPVAGGTIVVSAPAS